MFSSNPWGPPPVPQQSTTFQDPYRARLGALQQTYLSMAKQELSHVDALSDMSKRTVSEAKNANDPCLHGIEAILELEAERMAPWIVKIKMMMDGM